jgi:hypothetical protein
MRRNPNYDTSRPLLHFYASFLCMDKMNYHHVIIYKIRTNRSTCMICHRTYMVDTLRRVERQLAKKQRKYKPEQGKWVPLGRWVGP